MRTSYDANHTQLRIVGERARSWTLGDRRGQKGTVVSSEKHLVFGIYHDVSDGNPVMCCSIFYKSMPTKAAPDLVKQKAAHLESERQAEICSYTIITTRYVD